jgi:hypothetical protein
MNRKNIKPFVAPLSADQLRAEAEKLLRDGNMPSLEEVAVAALSVRMKYSAKIRRARRDAKRESVIN